MMSVRKRLLSAVIVAAAVAAAPRPAAADWTVTPFVGWNTGGSADVNGSDGTTRSAKFEHRIDYGVSIAGMGKGAFGAEFDLGYSPNFFMNTTNGDGFQFAGNSNVLTAMGNVIVGIPIGGHGGSVRPYAVGGVGLIRSHVEDLAGVFDVKSKNDFGFDLGGGAMAFFAQNIGIRGDVRYFRSFSGSSDNITTLGLSNFNFWRASAGVTFKF